MQVIFILFTEIGLFPYYLTGFSGVTALYFTNYLKLMFEIERHRHEHTHIHTHNAYLRNKQIDPATSMELVLPRSTMGHSDGIQETGHEYPAAPHNTLFILCCVATINFPQRTHTYKLMDDVHMIFLYNLYVLIDVD